MDCQLFTRQGVDSIAVCHDFSASLVVGLGFPQPVPVGLRFSAIGLARRLDRATHLLLVSASVAWLHAAGVPGRAAMAWRHSANRARSGFPAAVSLNEEVGTTAFAPQSGTSIKIDPVACRTVADRRPARTRACGVNGRWTGGFPGHEFSGTIVRIESFGRIFR